ncbi:hypothetical protein X975_06457, partial [Stegodyphus mimosarum]
MSILMKVIPPRSGSIWSYNLIDFKGSRITKSVYGLLVQFQISFLKFAIINLATTVESCECCRSKASYKTKTWNVENTFSWNNQTPPYFLLIKVNL